MNLNRVSKFWLGMHQPPNRGSLSLKKACVLPGWYRVERENRGVLSSVNGVTLVGDPNWIGQVGVNNKSDIVGVFKQSDSSFELALVVLRSAWLAEASVALWKKVGAFRKSCFGGGIRFTREAGVVEGGPSLTCDPRLLLFVQALEMEEATASRPSPFRRAAEATPATPSPPPSPPPLPPFNPITWGKRAAEEFAVVPDSLLVDFRLLRREVVNRIATESDESLPRGVTSTRQKSPHETQQIEARALTTF